MYRSSLFLAAVLVGTTVALVQPMAAAKSASEVKEIARAVTVEIKLKQVDRKGSGVIIKRQGDLYTLVTNRHVICGDNICSNIPTSEIYTLISADGQQYKVQQQAIRLLGNDLDLAIIQFRSNRSYPVVQMAVTEQLKVTNQVFTSGFPAQSGKFSFGNGEVVATVDKRLQGDGGGYTVIYDAPTLPGMSGGGVFNGKGQLVAIHGRGERYDSKIVVDIEMDNKIGINRGIPVHWLMESLGEGQINTPSSQIRAAKLENPVLANEYFITGFSGYVKSISGEPEWEKVIKALSKAIQLNPSYYYAYYIRGDAHRFAKHNSGSLSDYNQAININPKFAKAYLFRGILQESFDNIQDAVVDYSSAIKADPKFAEAYQFRGFTLLVHMPEYRDLGKQDLIKAVKLFREQGKNKSASTTEEVLQAWGVSLEQ
jgi:Trypsin-like peptidase domain